MERLVYRNERTLTRRICRPPKEEKQSYKNKLLRLRRHFKQFNIDVSEVCQWLMRFRPREDGNGRTDSFWLFFLKLDSDSLRRKLFDAVVHRRVRNLDIPEDVAESLLAVIELPRTKTAERLFIRLAQLSPTHREVILKSAAEWLVSRYLRHYENYRQNYKAWEKEKKEWESSHPELTEDVRNEFNKVFKKLGLRRKNPRICTYERLKKRKNDCLFAGERIGRKRHSPLCVKYKQFCEEPPRIKRKHFESDAKHYLEIRHKRRGSSTQEVWDEFEKMYPKARNVFKENWKRYLQHLGIKEETVLAEWRKTKSLPHCLHLGKDCEFNKHTDKCEKYRKELSKRQHLQKLEKLYREWRRKYLVPPSRPRFRYPSSKKLPLPKIFGKGFFEVDFNTSTVKLRLDDMPNGEWLVFGFTPWPKKYDIQPDPTEITSVHIHFNGNKARIAFRFEKSHKPSRFNITQEKIDSIRRDFPRQSQDRKFLEKAREEILRSFNGDPKKHMRILAVDLGTSNGAVALFVGKEFKKTEVLKLAKVNELLEKIEEEAKKKGSGLTTQHIAKKHLEKYSKTASKITTIRQKLQPKKPGLAEYDLRSLTLHIHRMLQDWVRLNASQIIKKAEEFRADLIIFESMRGFTPRYDELDKEKKQRLAFFSYSRIRRKTTEKAVERGMRVITVPYMYSSKVCSKCGKKQENTKQYKRNKGKGKFECEFCKFKGGSDENAARVLGRVFWGEIVLPEK